MFDLRFKSCDKHFFRVECPMWFSRRWRRLLIPSDSEVYKWEYLFRILPVLSFPPGDNDV